MTAPSALAAGGDARTEDWPRLLDVTRYDRRARLTAVEAGIVASLSIDRVRRVGLVLNAAALRPVARLV